MIRERLLRRVGWWMTSFVACGIVWGCGSSGSIPKADPSVDSRDPQLKENDDMMQRGKRAK